MKFHVKRTITIGGIAVSGIYASNFIVDLRHTQHLIRGATLSCKPCDKRFVICEHLIEVINLQTCGVHHLTSNLGSNQDKAPFLQAVECGHDWLATDTSFFADFFYQNFFTKRISASE
ncbi:hypothetical protein D3C76_1231440 [compost metagenome]